MRTLQHHIDRLLARWLEAEASTDPATARRALRKAGKHQKQIDRLRRKLRVVGLLQPSCCSPGSGDPDEEQAAAG